MRIIGRFVIDDILKYRKKNNYLIRKLCKPLIEKLHQLLKQ